jgi:hypothetical protein
VNIKKLFFKDSFIKNSFVKNLFFNNFLANNPSLLKRSTLTPPIPISVIQTHGQHRNRYWLMD